MENKSQLEQVFDEGEIIISDIMVNGPSSVNHRNLIQKKTDFLKAIWQARKDLKDKRLAQKASEDRDTKKNIDDWMAKTPARDLVNELSRNARYELEKLDIDMETMTAIAQNRTYHLRFDEIDLNKAGIPLTS